MSYEDLADEVVMGGAKPDYWREALVPSHTPSGRLIRVGPTGTTDSEMIPILSTGEAVSFVHSHARRCHARPDLVYVPVHDAPPAQWALLWRTVTDLIRSFAHTAREVGPSVTQVGV